MEVMVRYSNAPHLVELLEGCRRHVFGPVGGELSRRSSAQ